MSVTQSGVTHCGRLRYAVHLVGWMFTNGLACYGSMVCVAPHEARQGLRDCEAYLRRPPRSRTDENAQPT